MGNRRTIAEFLHVDDMADASVFLLLNYDAPGHYPIAYKCWIRCRSFYIRELSEIVRKVVDIGMTFSGTALKPDGTHRKLMDLSCLHNLGWKPLISLENGVKELLQLFKRGFK